MIENKLWYWVWRSLVAAFVILLGLYLWVKFATYHGVMKIDPKTGEDNLTQLCSGKELVLTYGEFFMCK